MYLSNWQEFQEAAENLYEKSPRTARYCVKWRGAEGRLVLKISDNTTCLKYKTHSSIFLNRFEALNLSLMRKMQNRRPAPTPSEAPVPDGGATAVSKAPAVSGVTPSAGGPAGGGVKKKKGKKKK